MYLATNIIYRNPFKSQRYTLQRQSSNMQKKKLHYFCNRSSPDDGLKSDRKY